VHDDRQSDMQALHPSCQDVHLVGVKFFNVIVRLQQQATTGKSNWTKQKRKAEQAARRS